MKGHDRDLERWMGRLIAVWRRLHRKEGPAERLLPGEVRAVAAGIRQLSAGLTRERSLVGQRYLDDERLLGAYLLFYWPVSYAQARSVLNELPRRPRSVLDLGSGPGPLAFAALDAGASEVTAADRSRQALAVARELALEAGEGLATREWSAERPVPPGSFDLVCTGHLLNELFRGQTRPAEARADFLERLLAQVKGQGSLVVLEPALRETSRHLLEVRDLLVRRGLGLRAPCLWRGDCPALLKESDWCHAERAWRPPRLVEELARAASLHKEELKMSYLIVAPRGEGWPEVPKGRHFRIVSEPLAGKGRQRYIGCGPEGRTGLALQEKHRTERNQAFFTLRRGEVVRLEATEPRGDGLALDDRSEVSVVARPGESWPRPYDEPDSGT